MYVLNSAFNGSYWGWVSGSPNLEQYLLMAQNHTGDPFATTADMLRYTVKLMTI
jgi:hypothetical protein